MTTEQRNADSSQVDAKRNAEIVKAIRNAERQRRYRDRKRGGPPVGRWAGWIPAKQRAELVGISRTTLFMCKWIKENAPDCGEDLHQAKAKVTPTYKRLRAEYNGGLFRAIEQARQEGIDTEKHQLTVRREGGKFVFEWV